MAERSEEHFIRQVPNLLSFLRVLFSFSLIFLIEKPVYFLAVYLFCGVTDVADGFIARRFQAESKFGAKLDSLGDFTFFMSALFSLFILAGIENNLSVFILTAVVFLIRGVNFLLAKIKFNLWGSIHTLGNKTAGFVVFMILPLCVYMGYFPLWMLIFAGAAAILSALEESLIILTNDVFDENKKSFFRNRDSEEQIKRNKNQ